VTAAPTIAPVKKTPAACFMDMSEFLSLGRTRR
jgi:hypothetical protein